MIPKTEVTVGAIVLVAVTAAVSAFVFSNWDPFPPTDYEDCAARAAKGAKSKDGLSVLLSICQSEFKGRRKPGGGGYAYYDEPCSDLGAFTISGPNPTPIEMKDINRQCLTHLQALREIEAEQAEQKRRAQQAAREAKTAAEQRRRIRALSAMTDVHVKAVGWGCSFSCDLSPTIGLRVEVTNGSMEALSHVLIGFAFVQSTACPSSYVSKSLLDLPLSPGETRTVTIDHIVGYYQKVGSAPQ